VPSASRTPRQSREATLKADRDGGNGLLARIEFFEAMLDARIFSTAALHVAHKLLYRHMNGTTGRCDPSRSTLAEETGLSRATVQRAIAELEENGWWIIGRNEGTAGRGGRTNTYRRNLERGLNPEPSPGRKMAHLSAKDVSPVEPRTRNLEPKDYPCSPRRGTAFEAFWAVYPSRAPHLNPRKPALEKFIAAVRHGTDPADIVRGAENFAAYAKQYVNDPWFIPQAATWLGRECWKEYQQPPEPAPAPRRHHGLF
jgi:Helix-turn-helix domain